MIPQTNPTAVGKGHGAARGGILGDAPGLGKTRIATVFLAACPGPAKQVMERVVAGSSDVDTMKGDIEQSKTGEVTVNVADGPTERAPDLVIVPKSLVHHWIRELAEVRASV